MSKDKTKPDSQDPVFRFLDRQADIEKTSRNLPHWFQVGAAIFVTFRTADSMPLEVLQRFRQELELWLKQNGLPLELANPPRQNEAIRVDAVNVATVVPNCHEQKAIVHDDHEEDAKNTEDAIETIAATLSAATFIPPHKLIEFNKLRARAWHRSLDECHGACLLKQPKLARIVAESLLHFDGNKYDLDSFVVMPNHVHAIVQFRPGGSLDTISQSWMRYTARQIHFETGEKGSFWQPEPFDHIVRNENQFAYLQTYIADNPGKASLRDGEYLYWQRGF